jgi:ketosteroid isomerase-like protein
MRFASFAAVVLCFPSLIAGVAAQAQGAIAQTAMNRGHESSPAVPIAAAATDSPAVRELQAVEDKWTTALNQRDQYGLELVLAPLFMDVSQSGVFTTRDQQIANLITLDDKTAATEQKVLAARVLGDVAIATGTYAWRHRVGNNEVLDKGIFTHVFQRQHGQWMCVSAQETPVVTETPGAKPKSSKTKAQSEMPFHIPFFTKGNSKQ